MTEVFNTPVVSELDDMLLSNITSLLQKVESESSESGEDYSPAADTTIRSMDSEVEAGFRVCSVHNRKRKEEYLECADGAWKCTDSSTCKAPRSTLKEEMKKKAPQKWYCECCSMVLNSKRQAAIHFEGGRHATKVKEMQVAMRKRGFQYECPQPRILEEGAENMSVAAKPLISEEDDNSSEQFSCGSRSSSLISAPEQTAHIQQLQQQITPTVVTQQPFFVLPQQLSQPAMPTMPMFAQQQQPQQQPYYVMLMPKTTGLGF